MADTKESMENEQKVEAGPGAQLLLRWMVGIMLVMFLIGILILLFA